MIRRSAVGTLFAIAIGLLSLPVNGAEIEGRVIHAENPAAAADVEVSLVGLDVEERTLRRTTRTDAQGRYRFSDLPHPAAYIVAAHYAGVRFPGGTAIFRPGETPETDPIEIAVYDPSSDPASVSIPTQRWILEHEAGEYRLLQIAVIRNDASRVVRVDDQDPPALRVALAPNHGEVTTPFGRLPEGVTLVDGVAEIRGPILPGEVELRLSYPVPSQSQTLATEISVLDPIDTLEVYVEDFGIEVDPGGLHPARAARENGRVYQAWLGFELGPGTRVPFQIRPLPPHSSPPRSLVVVMVAALVGGGLWLVGRPIFEARRVGPSEPPEPGELDREKEALRQALRDLEHDFETGKLSVADRDRLREDLKRDALRSLSLRKAKAPAADPARRCCARDYGPTERFCSSCGKPL